MPCVLQIIKEEEEEETSARVVQLMVHVDGQKNEREEAENKIEEEIDNKNNVKEVWRLFPYIEKMLSIIIYSFI